MIKYIILFIILNLSALAQKDKKDVPLDPKDAPKMIIAKQKLLDENYAGALSAYKDIEKSNPFNTNVKYYIAYCHYKLGQIPLAKESLIKAEQTGNELKPESHILLGRVYQLEENFEKAISHYESYLALGQKEPEIDEDPNLLLSHCKNAVAMMKSPLDVSVMNLGEMVNSKYDDKNPCITADGRMLIFTTRRPQNTSSATDVEGDGKFFEDVFMVIKDSAGNFGAAEGVSKTVNTDAHDACTSISADGKQIFIYKNDLSSRDARGGNIFVTKIANGKWRKPEPIGKPINSTYWEGGACVSPDGKTYFFTSERPGGFGKSDIWMVKRKSKDEWEKPENLGSLVNTPYDEAGMFLAPDGKTLFFCSNGPASMGSYDVFKTVLENGKWSAPVNIGYPVNSPFKEGQLTLSADAQYAYISSDRKGSLGESDVYRIDLKDYAILEKEGKKKGNGLSIVRGTLREGYEGYGIPDAEVTLTNDEDKTVQTTSSSEAGEYFFTVPAGNYTISIKKKGYQDITESFVVGASNKNTVVVEKGYLLKK